MKQIKICIALIVIAFSLPMSAVAPFIQPRSQSEDSARELVGWTRYINQYDRECMYGSWAFTLEYTQTLRPDDIRFNLFGNDIINDINPFIQISGSQVGDRNTNDWLADYFGLPTDFESQIFFHPSVDNVIFDINFYLGLDQWQDGLYFRVHLPVVYARWDLGFTEKVITGGTNSYPAGYFAPIAIPRSQLLTNFTEFATFGRSPNLGNTITFNPLERAKISKKRLTLTHLSDLQAAFGWNFLQSEDHHFGLAIRGVAPTGNRPKGIYLFEPLIGNGHHWEIGLGLTAHCLLFADECTCREVGFYFDANISHLFSTRQRRTFDLVEKPLSRYMLVEKLGMPVANLFVNATATQGMAAGAVAPNAQFQNLYTPLANLTTIDVDVRIAAQVDVTAMIDINWGNWNLDFGYNFWARTCEKIKPTCLCSVPFEGNVTFALKGDANVFGFVALDAASSPIPVNSPVPLSATESAADIHAGTNLAASILNPTFNPNQNPGVDGGINQWAFVAITDDTDQLTVLPGQSADLSTTNAARTQQESSATALFIQAANIDLEGAETKGLSNRLFAHVSYNWDRRNCNWTPFAGIGGFIELAHHAKNGDCADPDFDNSCTTVAFSQWGIWLKGGIAFD